MYIISQFIRALGCYAESTLYGECGAWVSNRLKERAGDRRHTPTNKAGTVARTARAKKAEMILGGFLGSARNVWWMGSRLP